MWYAGGVNDTAVCTASTISLESNIILGNWAFEKISHSKMAKMFYCRNEYLKASQTTMLFTDLGVTLRLCNGHHGQGVSAHIGRVVLSGHKYAHKHYPWRLRL